MSAAWALAISALLLALNAFFVSAEFALVAAKRHRLEQLAATGSRPARAALAGTRELSLMLAGAQLGITGCTLGLGALAEPAIAHLLEPLFVAIGIPEQVSYGVAFVLALAVVVFLHMVVGEMAPKSWAISHPETSALLLALPFRAFAWISRPALAALNWLANSALRVMKVTPQDELAQVHGPEELRLLLDASRDHGLLPAPEHVLLSSMLALQNTVLAEVMVPAAQIVGVPSTASATEVERVSTAAGRSRLAVLDGDRVAGIVHVRDAVRATTAGQRIRAGEMMSAALTMRADRTVLSAVRIMRERRAQLAVVVAGGETVGLIALEDLLEQVIGEFEDETDRTQTG